MISDLFFKAFFQISEREMNVISMDLKNIYGMWCNYWEKNSDPRVKDWFMIPSIFPTVYLTLHFFVTNIGPKKMKNRELAVVAWFRHYSWKCQAIEYEENEIVRRMLNVAWIYFMTKFLDFLDTIFFVLRKKFNQISTLHVIHHAALPLGIWYGFKLAPTGHGTFFTFLNSFVHVVMYFYYLIAALGPKMQKFLWWKKYLTIL